VHRAGSGAGSIVSNPAGIDCGSACAASFDPETTVVLTASPAAGSRFDAWSGACTGTAPTCSVGMMADRDVTAQFSLLPTLTISNATQTEGDDGTKTITFTVTAQ
jgi:hypothetical protein